MTTELTFPEIVQAGWRLRGRIPRTPLHRYPRLDDLLGIELHVKHENHHAIGSFKARGAFNAILGRGERPPGVIASSSGNHGQGVAFAARALDLPAVIVVPEWANEDKLAGIRALGAEVLVHGTSASETNGHARELAQERGWLIVDDFRDQLLMAGAGTIALEMLEDQPDLQTLLIPLGGGALASGCGTAAKAIHPDITTVGVQPAACQGTYRSWQAGEPVRSGGETIADGLAVDEPEPVTVDILRRVVDDVVLVTDEQMLDAMGLLMSVAHTLVEPSGAVGIAALRDNPDRFAGQRVGVILTGSNTRPSDLHDAVART